MRWMKLTGWILFLLMTLAVGAEQAKMPDSRRKIGPENIGDTVLVPAGEFTMGNDSGRSDEKPVHKVYLDTFRIDKYEVTVQQYQACVQAGKCSKPDEGDEFRDCNWGKSDRGNHPINCVDWNQAKVYCEWTGKRLPSEAEWEKAARGTDGRKYPWGNQEPTCEYAIMNDSGYGCGKNSTWPVGSKPKGASPYGAMDMAGNVSNWVADWYDKDYYAKSTNRNPTGPGSGLQRVVRGSSCYVVPKYMLLWGRYSRHPASRTSDLGFRCAR